MNMKKMILIGFVLLAFGKTAFGQHLGEFSANYSYMHYVPVDNLPTINLNGGGGAAVLYFAGFFGIKAEFEGYASENVNFSFPPGSARCPSGCTGTAEANRSEEHTSELQSRLHLVCRLLLEKKKKRDNR